MGDAGELWIHRIQINNDNDYGDSLIYFSSHSFHHSPSEAEVCIHLVFGSFAYLGSLGSHNKLLEFWAVLLDGTAVTESGFADFLLD